MSTIKYINVVGALFQCAVVVPFSALSRVQSSKYTHLKFVDQIFVFVSRQKIE